ncbi:MAG: hypothetical protein WB660_01950 [Candidatus Sulfotelmatobacter sp.]
MKYRKLPPVLLLCFSGLLLTVIAVIAQQFATEAPAGFSTPSFNGAQSISNGIVEPTGDTSALDQQHFEENEDIKAELGPVYNATSCVTCHQNPVTGGPSQITEIRVGHKDQNDNFVNPTVLRTTQPPFVRPPLTRRISRTIWAWPTSTILLSLFPERWSLRVTRRSRPPVILSWPPNFRTNRLHHLPRRIHQDRGLWHGGEWGELHHP